MVSPAMKALKSYQQADEEGVMVMVSRQAVDEVIQQHDCLYAELKRMTDHLEAFANDHSMDATAETWSAIHCARAALSTQGDE
ncbi:hypothetical protein MXMO3_01772 [Maritalea myrionectae]|uniref:Uncharacterized protein n=1 Tax=Maritalea myrionectae TaxID=454601 RepID=A0A2R4ME37_9HYPH|nr:hypothetical protein [Maritalea myrionectae]AVX04297.1 hypothetical protein MXMO3_01772 [Maritalea myrionectae]